MGSSTVDGIRQYKDPAYTGENRCAVCTVLNIAIALLLAVVFGVFWVELALGWLTLAILAIYFKGYLIPGTPTLTKRYAPAWLLQLTDHNGQTVDDEERVREIGASQDAVDHDAVDPDSFLRLHQVITPPDGRDGIALTEEFDDFLRSFEKRHRDNPCETDAVARVFGTDPMEVEVRETVPPKIKIGRWVRNWPTTEALLADVALAHALAEWTTEWDVIPPDDRHRIVRALRGLLTRCPACGNHLDASVEVRTAGCCIEDRVETLACTECERTIRSSNQIVSGTQRLKTII